MEGMEDLTIGKMGEELVSHSMG